MLSLEAMSAKAGAAAAETHTLATTTTTQAARLGSPRIHQEYHMLLATVAAVAMKMSLATKLHIYILRRPCLHFQCGRVLAGRWDYSSLFPTRPKWPHHIFPVSILLKANAPSTLVVYIIGASLGGLEFL
jgi:hypothetical protein